LCNGAFRSSSLKILTPLRERMYRINVLIMEKTITIKKLIIETELMSNLLNVVKTRRGIVILIKSFEIPSE